ncbi:MAG: hypothetical protein QN174_13510 [Armatimonadota bacterium]|nr:hypothetical protein [Armatimonadota bacterium]MDR7510579.1 hypothetical protein [Armatimonadota bacterium]
MSVLRLTTGLSYLLAALVTTASAAGLFVERVYALEQPIWAAQAAGQDLVNIAVAVPALAASAYLARRGSMRAWLVWLGVLIYLVYSYLLYAFFVHFGPLFPVYLAVLSLSFYLCLSAVLTADAARVAAAFSERAPVALTSSYMLVLAAVFVALEASAIGGALARGSIPEGAAVTGLPVDPVHVLDVALLFPGMALAALLLRRGRPLGYLLAGPLLTHMAILGVAVIAMMLMMASRGFPLAPAPMAVGVLSTAASLFVATRYLAGLARDT